MNGIRKTFFRCPFCNMLEGTEIGTCPDGWMRNRTIQRRCEGYDRCTTIQVQYNIPSYGLSRTAYFPNSREGREVFKLIKIAWEQRLIFSLGTSSTTGVPNTVVWNIHHKTALSGGVANHGYPDPTYLSRVKEELRHYNIV